MCTAPLLSRSVLSLNTHIILLQITNQLAGLPVIRAFNQQDNFQTRLQKAVNHQNVCNAPNGEMNLNLFLMIASIYTISKSPMSSLSFSSHLGLLYNRSASKGRFVVRPLEWLIRSRWLGLRLDFASSSIVLASLLQQ